jgi:hypothetical protein
MAGVFQNIDSPSPSPPGECVPMMRGGHTRQADRGVGGQYFGRRLDTALYSTYGSTL